jgi:LysR family transcriptional regulator, repressor for citA
MDTRLLRTYIAAARLQNFHQAAEKLFLAQPTVSAHIRLLESELGCELFERTGKRVRLTAAGERFLPHAQRVLDSLEAAMHDLTAWQQGYETRLSIMASPVVAASTLPSLLKRFTRQYPRVEVMVLSGTSPETGEQVAAGVADIGLSRMPAAGTETESTILYHDPVLLVGPRSCLDDTGATPDWRRLLASHMLLTRNHPMYWDDLLLALSQQNVPLRTLAVDRVDVTKRMVEEGLGVSFLPQSAIVRELAEGRLVEVEVDDFPLPIAATYVVVPTSRSVPHAARWFREMLFEVYPQAAEARRTAGG